MRKVKLIAIFLVELLVEGILLGGLMGVMLSFQVGLLNGMIGSIMGVPGILGLHGYYISRILVVIARMSRIRWLYPCVAALVFVAHVLFIFWKGKSDVTAFARAISLPFLIGGTIIVYANAVVGTSALRKWAAPHGINEKK